MKYFVTIDGATVEVTLDGDRVTVDGQLATARVERVPGSPIVQLTLDGVLYRFAIERHDVGRAVSEWRLIDDGTRREVRVETERQRHINSLSARAGSLDHHAMLNAPMPGLVLRVMVEVGAAVEPGRPLVALEAMKMENELKAGTAGIVSAVHVAPGQAVEKGQVLLELTSG